jgi:helicase
MKDETVKKVLELSKISSLNSMQNLALKKGLLDEKNLVVAAPTASGKTLLCELAALNLFMNKKSKMIYMAPLVALVSEKYESFKQKYSKLGVRVAMSVGDYDSTSQWLADYDWILTSNEKCDSLMRHNVDWIRNVGLIVVDEIHMLQDPSRGPTLEVTLTRLRETVPHAQILALSATIQNVKELGEWLDAETVISDYRPVELHEGIYLDSKIQFFGRDSYELNPILDPEPAILQNTINMKKQALYFVATRKYTESLAENLGRFNQNFLGRNEKRELTKLSDEIKTVLEIPTRQCRKLADCVKDGVAFHHAGLLYKQKKLIEDSFKNGLLRCIVATPTLAYGVNLPAFRVVIRDLKRYYIGEGARPIPVLEYKQFAGRSGRPDYDEFGESILIARSEDEAQELTDKYILGEPEEIHSKLAFEPILRMHTLALIASGLVKNEDSLMKFFEKTFFSYQYGDVSEINSKLESILEMLVDFCFIMREDGKLIPTKIGKRVSELYIDPFTAHHIIKCLERAMKIQPDTFIYLHMITDTLEMKPFLSVSNKEFEEINNIIATKKFLTKIPNDDDLEFDDFLKSVKTTLILQNWIDESTEDQILVRFKVTPGDLWTRLRNTDWLLYASQELALLLGYKKLLNGLRKIRVRVKYGVKEELIPLVRLQQIGRIRARKLYNADLKTISDLKKIPLPSLERIVGPNVAAIIKKQLGEKVEEVKEEKQVTLHKEW